MPHTATNYYIMAGATVIVLAGVVDDMYGMPAKIKLLIQIIAALIAIRGGVQIHFITNPLSETGMSYLFDWLSFLITLFWLVGITNTINLIDGLDGLASGVASIAATTLLFTAARLGHDFIVMQCAIIAGASLGFLPFNFNPAKIFMGDTGSLLLGYMPVSYTHLDVYKRQGHFCGRRCPRYTFKAGYNGSCRRGTGGNICRKIYCRFFEWQDMKRRI